MPIQAVCPNCQKGYNLADTMQGKNVKCKNCDKIFLVGAVAAKPAAAPAKTSPTAAMAKGRAKLAPKKTAPKPAEEEELMDVLAADADEDEGEEMEEDDRPARKASRNSSRPDQSKKKGSGMLWLLLGGGGAFGFVALLVCMGGLWYLFGSGGFGKTLDMAAYRKLKAGMTEAEVTDILGKPTENAPGGGFGINTKTSIWKQGDSQLSIVFMDGKASMASGALKDEHGKINLILGGFESSQVAQGPPPASNPLPGPNPPGFPPVVLPPGFPPFPPVPPPNNPPPPNPPPVQPPPNNPPPVIPDKKGSKLTQETYNKINNGMKAKDVYDLIGNSTPNRTQLGKGAISYKTPNGLQSQYTEEWRSGQARLKVYYDKGIDGVVIDKEMAGLPEK
jgi:hypothetical protein